MNRLPLLSALFASVAAGGLVAGCGGDGSPPPAPPPPVATDELPASAVASGSALEAFAIGLAPSDATEPLKLDQVTSFPTSETDEPVALP